MITAVLGAPGSGKSALAPVLRPLLREHVVLDWDDFMGAASALAGREVRTSRGLWPAYRQLVRSVVDAVTPTPVVLFTVCTRDELPGWPVDRWLLLDCDDVERRRRLAPRRDEGEVAAALADARAYRALDLDLRLDTTRRAVSEVAAELARLVHRPSPQ